MARICPMSRNPVDSGRVRRAFSRHAEDYDAYARVQKRVVLELLRRLEDAGLPAGPALEIGCGTGELSRHLLRERSDLKLTLCDIAHGMTVHASSSLPGTLAVDAHAQALPLRRGGFALVLSSSVYQWVDDLFLAFAESARVLAPGGIFAFALFGAGTLHELRRSYRRAAAECGVSRSSHLQEFHSREDVGRALDAAGFDLCSLESVDEVERHGDVPELLRHLKKIGADNAARNRPAGMAPRRVMQRMISLYQEGFGASGTIPATYEVVYGIARKPRLG